MSNLAQVYQKQVVPSLMKQLGLKNSLAVPKVEKVIINIGLGEAVADGSVIQKTADIISKITGQKPKVARARKAIAGFKLREDVPIGLVTTLRGRRMYHFLEKLFKIVLPRLRDFQGVALSSFDGRGNYNLGLAEQIIFPEVDFSKIDKIRGLQITIVTNAGSNEKGKLLLAGLGMPFEKKT